MQSCCIQGCDSYKRVGSVNIGYFKFPLHDEVLLRKWLKQIGQTDWHPSDYNQICSAHFRAEDISCNPNRKHPCLKSTAVPTIFPSQPNGTSQSNKKVSLVESQLMTSKKEVTEAATTPLNIKNETSNGLAMLQAGHVILIPTQLNQLTNVASPLIQLTPMNQTRLRRILPKPDNKTLSQSDNLVQNFEKILSPKSNETVSLKLNDAGAISPTKQTIPFNIGNRKPILRITINKRYHKEPSFKKPESFETMFIPDYEYKTDGGLIKIKHNIDETFKSNTRSKDKAKVELDSPYKAVVHKSVSAGNEKKSSATVQQNTKRKIINIDSVLVNTGEKTKSKPQGHLYSEPSNIKLRYLYTKARQDCNQLRKRLKVLRQRYNQEQQEIKKLQGHLADLGKKVQRNCSNDNFELKGRKRGKTAALIVDEREDEYEKLLREVRKIKQDIKRTGKNKIIQSTNLTERTTRISSNSEHESGINVEEKDAEIDNEEEENSKIDLTNITEEGEIIGEIDEDCDEMVEEMEDSMEMRFNEEDRSLGFNEEFLDPELIDDE